jgi:hypothetical protein
LLHQLQDNRGNPISHREAKLPRTSSETDEWQLKTISKARKSDEIEQIINAGVLSQLGRFGVPTIPPGDIQVHLSFVFFDYFSSSTLIIDAFIVVGETSRKR